jgi:hypothetical protein
VRTVVKPAIMSTLTSRVCIAVLAFAVSVPATSGYFSVCERVTNIAVLFFGSYVEAFG